jgi:hypothetical protein
VIALSSMIVLPRAMSLGPSPDEGFMEKSYCTHRANNKHNVAGFICMRSESTTRLL